MVDLLIAPFRNGHAREQQKMSAKCETFSRNMRDLCNFLGPFPLHDSGENSNLSIWKTRKRPYATNPLGISRICVWHPQTFLTSLTTSYACRNWWGFDAWSAHCVGNSEGFDMKPPKQPTFFDEFPLRLLFFRFRFEPPPPLFLPRSCVFFFVCLLTFEVKTDENLDVSFSFFVDAECWCDINVEDLGDPPRQQGGETYVCLLMSQVPSFFLEGILQWKKHLSTQNSKCSSFLIEKMLILFVWFFLVGGKLHQ